MKASSSLRTVAAIVAATAVYANNQAFSESLDLSHPSQYSLGDPVRDDFDCQMRYLAIEYAQFLQPWRTPDVFQEIADALNGSPEKASNCTVAFTPEKSSSSSSTSKLRMKTADTILSPSSVSSTTAAGGGATFFVDAVKGSDANSGTVSSPFKTLGVAVAATRANPGWDTIVLRNGTYTPGTTVLTAAQDNGLTIQAYPGEEVWISGATPLANITWNKYNVDPSPAYWVQNVNENAIYAEVPSLEVYLFGTTATANACQVACQANNTATGLCNVYTWHDQNQGEYALQCYFRSDGLYNLVADPGHTSGRLTTGPNVWVTNLAGTPFASSGVPGLRFNGKRLIRARYPNADPEWQLFMPPFVFRANWTAQNTPRAPDVQIDLPASYLNRNSTVSMFQTFTSGIGGTCDRFQPNAGYWCSANVQGGGSVIYYVPTAMQAGQDILPNSPYKNPTNAVVQTWRPGHWASWMYTVGSAVVDPTTNITNMTFSAGGFQGSRGENTGEDTYIENVFEELDAPAEWYYDETTQDLYIWWNATAGVAPPSDGSITITQSKWLFNITGTQAVPVTDISLIGLGLRDTAYTYMDPHSIPSGGDWTLERSAVVFLEGTERVTVSGCVFERVDGNAIVLSAYNRNASIVYNEFRYIGATAVAMWGSSEGGDARLPDGYGADLSQGNQPRFNTVAYNLCHELGIWEKQSSFYTQFKSMQNTVHSNIVYNGPRAHINFNDGAGGGATLARNLIFNSCRESGDHGPFNSWDRDPMILNADGGGFTTQKKMENIHNNFIIANYNSLGAIDNDDGSSYYTTTNNFFVYGSGGLKNDFEGHDNWWIGNVVAWCDSYALHNGYGGEVGTPGKAPYYLDGHEDMFINNTVAFSHEGDYALPVCNGQGKTILSGNTIYTPLGNITECGMSLAAWQAQGNDPGTTASAYPATLADDMIAGARAVLFVSFE